VEHGDCVTSAGFSRLLGLGFSLCLARPLVFFRDFPAKAKAKSEKRAQAR
jgi:hypothetical protein